MYAPRMATALGEYQTTRRAKVTTNGHRPPRISPSVILARWLATHLPALATVRTLLLHAFAAVSLVYGVYLILGTGAAFVVAAVVALAADWWLTTAAEASGP